ncbi:hypothetical protein SUGI_0181620 [Cryptomeria japonica]|nr:hypothetical protein SUGI_0181620 [Cryptomeria japonica]
MSGERKRLLAVEKGHSEYFTVSHRRERTIIKGRASPGVLVSEMVAEFVVASYRLSANLDATRQQSTQKLGLHGAIHVRLCLHEMLLTVDIRMIPLREIPIPPPNRVRLCFKQ